MGLLYIAASGSQLVLLKRGIMFSLFQLIGNLMTCNTENAHTRSPHLVFYQFRWIHGKNTTT